MCSEADLTYVRQLVRKESGNILAAMDTRQLEARLRPVANRAGAPTLEEFVTMLRTTTNPQLNRAVADAMAIHETSFFRDAGAFAALREIILPRLIAQNTARRTLRIWSAACSTGQEAYSVAMLLSDSFPELADWDVSILGTDLSRTVVEYARAARYRRMEVNRGLPARMLVRHFDREADEWQLKTRVRALCRFEEMNLCAPSARLPVFDLILLRNVLLYFGPADRTAVLRTAHRHLAPHGQMLLGAAEQAEDSSDLFRAEFAPDCYFYHPLPAA